LIIQALKNSLITLANHQAKTGAIPSNVIPGSGKTSYGSLAGRVDATTWWLIAAAIYYRESNDQDFYQKVYPKVIKAFEILDAWEFNERYLIYTPLSGNWADEYPLHGYLLYDNCLRLWALKAWALLSNDPQLIEKSKEVYDSIAHNFWPSSGSTNLYHPRLGFDQNQKFWLAGFHPGGPYSGIFDAAGNAFACLLGLATDQQSRHIFEYLQAISVQLGKKLIPAFWPVISEGDPRWLDLAHNYAYPL
jgi:GH15 family glucan-1,4-alpha-glucosidase